MIIIDKKCYLTKTIAMEYWKYSYDNQTFTNESNFGLE